MNPNVVASIKARLLNLAHQAQEDFQFYLVRYACERFLYRLGISDYRDRCILKGAGLLTLWMREPYRGTRDLDFLLSAPNDEASVRKLMSTVSAVNCPEDGLTFDIGTLVVNPIRSDEEYAGQRAWISAYLGKARIRTQVDFGFGDAVTPGPDESNYPTLLPDVPAPRIRAYPREVSIAEKFEAMVKLGRRNSRMKDFHDIWMLSSAFDFEGPVLRNAVFACFDRRKAPWPEETPDVLSSGFYEEKSLRDLWASYLRRGGFLIFPPEAFEKIGERMQEFLDPVRVSIIKNTSLEMRWPAGGPWEEQFLRTRGWSDKS